MAILRSSSTASDNTRIEEARQRAHQAGSNVDSQEEKIRWMRLSGVSTGTAEKALRTMLKIRDQTVARFMSEAAKEY